MIMWVNKGGNASGNLPDGKLTFVHFAKTVNEELFFWDMFAAYVNEDHPEVQKILDEVLKEKTLIQEKILRNIYIR